MVRITPIPIALRSRSGYFWRAFSACDFVLRGFSQGERAQFPAPDREQHIANRELGTIEKIDDSGNLQVRLDSGRTVEFNVKDKPHLDYGYAVTSHSSQGQTADRVLIYVDTSSQEKNS